ncbi:hypothetical protein A3C23_01195 [Candidatus Roizmanbacteria bacterium RIFCSPHIGHO2_02_FULL_37_13b]|uniref:Glycosyltransferase RgtA/B/C/D-like domain-containing protein n=1 Tax=Candidatus Roizmanbacteria bacterium RIFCSPLOWO2_02_FULL_36_11 TaxID=1802071 RepID=A0A1F7JHG3_9BACT|nr:MAG: hypothetical protein A3C23_01195 [Candidatus Roizmanbacteria bacterium RIFCSPHIGHO2_02_FULL_37_13b]OGK55044.1 MAG: hypothetical protein A3H78_01040 [Candidatus Roizmanbacteria bacterium RIFCSPLOWO2_02_FULL_36_11]
MIRHVITNRRLFICLFILASIYLALSYIPNIYEAMKTKDAMPDRHLILAEHIYTYDYNVYLSKIRQGIEGRWTVINKYDNQPSSKGIYLQLLYLYSGKIGGLFGLSPGVIFHTLRTILSIIWVALTVYTVIFFLKSRLSSTLGVLFCLLSSSFPILQIVDKEKWISMYMSWWQELDPMKRISYIPHYTINYIIISVLTILMYLHFKTGNKKYFYSIVIILFFSFFIHPSGGLVFLISWVLFQSIHFIWTAGGAIRPYQVLEHQFQAWMTVLSRLGILRIGQTSPEVKTRPYERGLPLEQKNASSSLKILRPMIPIIIQTLVLFLVAAIPILYIKSITSVYPWKSLIDFDKLHPLPFSLKEYILALGPLFFTGLAGAIVVLWKKKMILLPVVTWIFAAFIGILFCMKFPIQSPTRFMQVANHVPLAILSAYLFKVLFKKYKNYFINLITQIVIALIILLGIAQSYYSIKGQNLFNYQKAVAGQPIVAYPPQVTHPLKDVYNGYLWLRNNTKKDDVVLSKINAGNYIPAYSGNFVYFGHNPETPDFDKREIEVNDFLKFTLNEKEALKFLKDRSISYLFFGPQEREAAGWQYPTYSFLKPTYNSPWMIIYHVNF